MGIIDSFKRDFKNFWNWMPNEVKVYENEGEGVFGYEINNPPNPYVPERIRYFRDTKKGILRYHTQKIKDETKKISSKKFEIIDFK